MAPRSFWKGYLKLSLVTCPVAMTPATSENEKVRFHTLNAKTGNRVVSQYVDAISEKPVDEDDEVKGYQRGEDDYVMLEDDEIEAVALEAVVGLAAMAEAMGTFFTGLRYAAATYLVWFGISLIRSEPAALSGSAAAGGPGGLWISFAAGIGLTLGDVKAILFYAALFPVFVDLTAVTITDIALIAAITLIAVAGVKIGYAVTAATIAKASQGWSYRRAAQRVAGGAMIAAAGALALKS